MPTLLSYSVDGSPSRSRSAGAGGNDPPVAWQWLDAQGTLQAKVFSEARGTRPRFANFLSKNRMALLRFLRIAISVCKTVHVGCGP